MGQQDSIYDKTNIIHYPDLDSNTNGDICIIYPSNDTLKRKHYYGKVKNGKREGKGFLEWNSGTTYYGNWDNDKISGFGTFNMEKRIYEGEFTDNQFNGSGVLSWKLNLRKYEGQWKNNTYDGFGKMIFSEDDSHERLSYIGEWSEGKRHGYGIMKWTRGSTYEGNWVHGKRQGKGKQICSNGDIYIGYWHGALRHGQGIRIANNGDKYIGTWVNDKMHGYFEYITSYGRITYKMYNHGLEIKDIKQDVPSLQIYCIETIAKNRKQFNLAKNTPLPKELSNAIKNCKKQQKNVFVKLLNDVINT